MKLLIVFFTVFLFSCSPKAPKLPSSTVNADSLAAQLEELREKYRPGLGEIMGGIQMHHAKLWYAAINENWKLADYEIKEIKERLEEAIEIETNRPEVKNISMMYPAIDSVQNSITQQNMASFKNHFQLLTNTCNDCHTANHFEFNVITIPTSPPVSNQDFKLKVK